MSATANDDLLHNSRFLKACRREPVDRPPVWIMRQAGRYLPEYMAVRSKVTFIELCKTPELAAQVTLDAQRILGVDAAILFADLLPILEPMGLNLEYLKGEGPKIHNPVRDAAAIDALHQLESAQSQEFVMETVKIIRRELPSDIPLIGFAGAPFTLASYAIEGGGSKNYIHTKSLMFSDEGAWRALMEKLVATVSLYLKAQVAAGCQAVQVFDSWAGCLSPSDYRRYVLPYSQRLIESVTEVPVIHFVHGNAALLPMAREAGGDVLGIDWRVELADAWEVVGHDRGVQGNFDPIALYGDLDSIRERAHRLLDSVQGRPGHIFNLGHGVTPDVPHEHVKALVKMVQGYG